MKLENSGKLAKNRATPLEALAELAGNSSVKMRREMTKNSSTPVALLEWLAENSKAGSAGEVARNKNASVEALESGSRGMRTGDMPSGGPKPQHTDAHPRAAREGLGESLLPPLKRRASPFNNGSSHLQVG